MSAVFPVQKFVEIHAFHYVSPNKNHYLPDSIGISATQLLDNYIVPLHDAIGDYNLVEFIRVDCQEQVNPDEKFSDWPGTVNSYCTAVKNAIGGEIIPNVDLDVYICQSDCGTPCGPSVWLGLSQSTLLLDAIRNGLGYQLEESYAPAWYAHENADKSIVDAFFASVRAQGWKYFMPNINPPLDLNQDKFPSYGNAGYISLGIGNQQITSTPPYVDVKQDLIDSIWSVEGNTLNGVILRIERQLQSGTSAIEEFGALPVSVQKSVLTTIAQNQSQGRYTFSYPILVGSGPNFDGYVYDASKVGTLSTIEDLLGPPRTSSKFSLGIGLAGAAFLLLGGGLLAAVAWKRRRKF